jgi:hypothetical protein
MEGANGGVRTTPRGFPALPARALRAASSRWLYLQYATSIRRRSAVLSGITPIAPNCWFAAFFMLRELAATR